MTRYIEIGSLKVQPNDSDNRMIFKWIGPDNIYREYFVNQGTLKNFTTEAQIKAALDDWTQKSFGYTLNDIWFHKNDDGTWTVATGVNPPSIWPEDEPIGK